MIPRLLTTEEFARSVRLSPNTVRQRRRRGEISAVNKGTKRRPIWLFEESEVHRFIATNKAEAA